MSEDFIIDYKEQAKDRREINQAKKKDKREKKQKRSQSEFVPHGNQYKRRKQKDREESKYEDFEDIW